MQLGVKKNRLCCIIMIAVMICSPTLFASQSCEKTPQDILPHETTIIIDPKYDILLHESFESDLFPPHHWQQTICNDANTWQLDTSNAFQGNHSARCCFDPEKNKQDEWLITSTVNIAGYTEIFLEFRWFMSYFWSVRPYDHYDFSIYVASENTSDWTMLWNEEEVEAFDNWVWLNSSLGDAIDLSPYCDQETIRIGFQYNGTDGAQLNIDDIIVYGRKITNPLSIHANGPYTGYVGWPVRFYSNATGGEKPYRYSWDFGDGTLATEKNPAHTYDDLGNYTVKLQVTDTVHVTKTDITTVEIINMSKTPELIIANITGNLGITATICNKCCVDAENIQWKIYITNRFFEEVTQGNISIIEKMCSQQIRSQVFNGFGFMKVDVQVTADNMKYISKQTDAVMIGKYIFPL